MVPHITRARDLCISSLFRCYTYFFFSFLFPWFKSYPTLSRFMSRDLKYDSVSSLLRTFPVDWRKFFVNFYGLFVISLPWKSRTFASGDKKEGTIARCQLANVCEFHGSEMTNKPILLANFVVVTSCFVKVSAMILFILFIKCILLLMAIKLIDIINLSYRFQVRRIFESSFC